MLKIITSNTFIGVIVGGIITFLTEWCIKKYEVKQELSHSASLLLNDLKSIANYVNKAKSLSYPTTNIRYSEEWQNMVTNCTFLNNHEISLLYEIYDLVYDYNYEYERGRKEQHSAKGATFPVAHEILPALILDNLAMKALYIKLEKYCGSRKKH